MSSKSLNINVLWEKYHKNKSLKNKNKLIEYYYSFVKKIAYKLSRKLNWKVQPPELTSLGLDGLYRAIDAYDPEKGVKFESYAYQRIKGSMIDGLRREDLVPRSVRMTSEQFKKHKQRLENHLGHRISDPELIDLLGMNEIDFHKNCKKYNPTVFSSLDQSVNNESDDMKQDTNSNLEDKEAASPEAKVFRKEFFNKLMGKNFSKIERSIVYLYYYKDLTMDKISEKIGLSESRISQIHKEILDRLKEKIDRNPDFFNEDIYSHISDCKDPLSLT